MTEGIVEIRINCPDISIAEKIADGLLCRRLAAAVNIIPGVRSHFRWEGERRECLEFVLVAKTRKSLFRPVSECVREIHPYQVPAVTATGIEDVNDDYKEWVLGETGE